MGCANSQPAASEPASPAVQQSQTRTTGVLSRKLDRQAFPVWRPSTALSQSQIDAMRNEYWHTRVTGVAEIWTTLRAASEAVLSEDFDLANAILEANLVQMDGGSLGLCYDELGNQYNVPEFCFVHPKAVGSGSTTSAESSHASSKAGKEVTVKVRLYPGEKHLTITINDGHLVSDLKKAIADEAMLSGCGGTVEVGATNQRMLYMGRELKDNQVIAVANIEADKIVQTYVRPIQR